MKLLGSRELCWGLESTHLLNLLVDHSPLSAMCTLDWSKCRCWSSKSTKVCQLVQVKLCGFQELIIISSWSLDWFSKKKHDDSNLNNLWVAKIQKSKIPCRSNGWKHFSTKWTILESTSCHLQSQSAYLLVAGTRFQFESLGLWDLVWEFSFGSGLLAFLFVLVPKFCWRFQFMLQKSKPPISNWWKRLKN